MDDSEIALMLEQRRREKGADGVTAADIIDATRGDNAVTVKWQHAVAVVVPELKGKYEPGSLLWMLYVHPQERGKGYGKRFVKHLANSVAITTCGCIAMGLVERNSSGALTLG